MEDIFDHINQLPQGETLIDKGSPASAAQFDYILSLLDTSILATVQKDQIQNSLTKEMSSEKASEVIEELLQAQKQPLERVKEGELLLMSDLKTAIRKAVENPNT